MTSEPVIDEVGRPEPPLAADELATLVGFLEFQRGTLAWKCTGLDSRGMRATLGTSTMTLGGLMKHLAGVEDYWFRERLHGHDPDPYWAEIDWASDPDWQWHSAAQDSPADLFALWQRAVAASREAVQEALGAGGLDQAARVPFPEGDSLSLRWILCHMVEEYARHNGHADMLRESVDGATGE